MDCTVSTGAAAMMAVRVLLVRVPQRSPALPSVSCAHRVAWCNLDVFVSGPRCSGGQDPAGFFADGRNGSPLSCLRFPTGQNHHHSRGQEGQ